MGQNEIVLIDTSSWVEALRTSGQNDIRERVERLIINGCAAWCDMVAVELWNGVRGNYEKRNLARLEAEILSLPINDEVWSFAKLLTIECRKTGKTIPPADLIITSCALYHKTGLEHCDAHMESILTIYKKNESKFYDKT